MFAEVLSNLFNPAALGLIIGALALGNFVGCMPGLTATMALAVLIPFTYYMPISLALIMLGSIYVGAIRGGGITAILVNIPGTPADIATTFDGYPMAKQGKAQEALMMSIFASVMGGLVGNTFLLLVGYPLAKIALKFGPPEMFWISILGITIMVSLSDTSLWKGLISGFLGLLVTAVGVSPLGGETRFTFGFTQLAGGVPIIAGLIGLYCIPRIIEMPQETATGAIRDYKTIVQGGLHATMWKVIKNWFSNIVGLVSSIIGTLVGVLPGAGGNIAGILAYDQVRRFFVKDSRNFGKGDIRGVTCAETANNATVSSSLVPMLTFGVPGSPPAAVLMGAILVQGLRPGAELFTKNAVDVYTFICGLFLANLLLLPVGMYLSNLYSRVMYVPREILAASIAVMSVVGTIAVRGNVGDMYVMGLLGLLMFVGGRFGFSAAPAVLGIVLGRISEEGLTQSMMIGQAKGGLIPYFLGRPITVTLIVLTLLSLAWPYLQNRLKKSRTEDSRIKTITRQQIKADQIISLLLVLLCAFIFYKITGFTRYGAIFPFMVTLFTAFFALIYCVSSWVPFFRKKAGYRVVEAEGLIPDRTSFGISLGGIVLYVYLLVPYLGFLSSSILYLFGSIVLIRYFRSDIVRFTSVLIPFVYSLAFSGLIFYIFRHLLHIHLPKGLLL